MPNPKSSRSTPDQPGLGSLAWGAGAAVLMVACCAGSALIAAGALGAVGAWLAIPWVIGLAVALGAASLVGLVRRTSSSHIDDCCPPERVTTDITTPHAAREKDH